MQPQLAQDTTNQAPLRERNSPTLFIEISLSVSKILLPVSKKTRVFRLPFEHDGRELFFLLFLRRRSADKGSWRAGARQGHFLPINDHIRAKVARRIARHSLAVLTAQDADQLHTAIE